MISITDLPQATQLNANMAISIFNDLQSEREQDRQYYQRIISDQAEQIAERDERIADLEQRLEAEICTNKQLRDENSKLLLSNTRMADRLYLYDLQRSTEKKVNANPTLDSGSKIIANEIIRHITNEHDDPHTPTIIVQEDIAERCGVSSATVTRVKKKIAQAGGWQAQTSKPELLENGKWKTETTFMLENIIDRPDLVTFEKHAGGARLRQDKQTGEQLDTISIDYSRSQETAYLRMLPGQRADLDPAKILDAIKNDRCILDKYAYNRTEKLAASTDNLKNRIDQALSILDDQDEKQDAFESPACQLPTIETEYTPGTTLREVVDRLDEAIANTQTQPKKQDAFRFASFAGIPMTENIARCRAHEALNKDGQPAHKLEAIVSWRECGSTQWQWSADDGCRICARCWTPQR